MRLSNQIIEEIAKSVKTGMYVKDAVEIVGISRRTFYSWKEQGEKLDAKCVDEDGEIIQKEYKKLTKNEKLKLHFLHTIRQSEAEGKQVLVAAIFSQIGDDWKAAMEILARRYPQDWARKEYMDFKGPIDEDAGDRKLKELEERYKGVSKAELSKIASELKKRLKDAENRNNKSIKKKTSKN